MNRGNESTRRLDRRGAAAAIALWCMLAAPAASAAPAATDEYRLDLQGARGNIVPATDPSGEPDLTLARTQPGVAGEGAPQPSLLSAAGAAASGAPIALLGGLAGLIWLALAARPRSRLAR